MPRRLLFVGYFFLALYAQLTYSRVVREGENSWDVERQTAQSVFDAYITQKDINTGNFTITVPGWYALAENINFTNGTAIIIAANNVTLDLNEHTISGSSTGTAIAINSGATLEQVIVRNGFIQNSGLGIYINQLEQGSIDSMFFLQTNGILLISPGMIKINDCAVNGLAAGYGFSTQFINALAGNPLFQNCVVNGCLNGFITANSSSDITKSITIQASHCTTCMTGYLLNSNAFIQNCTAEQSTTVGFQTTGFITLFKDCYSRTGGAGFIIKGISFLRNCFAFGHTAQGFLLGTVVNDGVLSTIDNCISQNNQNGFVINSSFTLVKSCVAANNSVAGFTYGLGTVENAFTNNVSYGNGTDFVNVPATSLVATNLSTGASSIQALDATYWWNVTPI